MTKVELLILQVLADASFLVQENGDVIQIIQALKI
jgi:hypothetical protein